MGKERKVLAVAKWLACFGWVLVRFNGSHHVFAKPGEARPLVLPVSNGRWVGGEYVRWCEKKVGAKFC